VIVQAGLASGLLAQEQIDAACRRLAEGAAAIPPADDDARLAECLVELGFLNLWQVEQLRRGRTKFTLGPYRILDAIGFGGMGYVFKGEHSLLGRIEAIKVLPRSKSDPASVASFCREIRAQAQLDHPNLVRLSFADREGDTYFLVTEYVPGCDLRRLVRHHGPLTTRQAAAVVAQAAEALAYAHQRGLVHRDVKPGNLLVTPDGRVKLADLGLAEFASESATGVDAAEGAAPSVVGTPDFLAPEAVLSPGKVQCASDIYSLGCTLYYAVTGKVPFPGGKMRDKLRRHVESPPVHPSRLAPDLDPALVELIAAMIHKDPAQRLASAEEVIRRLQPWLEPADATVGRELGQLALAPGDRSLAGDRPVDGRFADTAADASPAASPPQVAVLSKPDAGDGLPFVALVLLFAALSTTLLAIAAALLAR